MEEEKKVCGRYAPNEESGCDQHSRPRYIPDSALPYDDVKRVCKRCGAEIQPPRVTAGFVGSGRVVYGGWYSFSDDPGPYCDVCAPVVVRERSGRKI